jgi:hypothetical protein
MTSQSGPNILAALFCERVLTERDSVPTLIRLVDRFVQVVTIGPETSEQDAIAMSRAPMFTSLSFFVWLQSQSSGSHQLAIRFVYDDSSESFFVHEQPVDFSSSGEGGFFVINLASPFPREGKVWAEVLIDAIIRTRASLTLVRTVQRPTPVAQ